MVTAIPVTVEREPRMDEIDDVRARQLTASVARGDELAFQTLYDLYHGRLTRFALVAARGDELLADEIVQSTFLTTASSIKRLESAEHLWNWLARVARQHLGKALRARGRDWPADALTDELPVHSAPDTFLEECLGNALLALEPEDRQVIEWHYFENLSHKDIAERLGATPKAVSSRLERARARLRAIVNKALSHET